MSSSTPPPTSSRTTREAGGTGADPAGDKRCSPSAQHQSHAGAARHRDGQRFNRPGPNRLLEPVFQGLGPIAARLDDSATAVHGIASGGDDLTAASDGVAGGPAHL